MLFPLQLSMVNGMTMSIHEQDNIRLGLMAPLSGPMQIYGKEITNAANIACNQINAAGGLLGRKIQLIIADDGSLAESAVLAAKKLIHEFNCIAIVGNRLPSATVAVSEQVSQLERIPQLNFSRYEGSVAGRYFFNFAALPNQQLEHAIPYMVQNFGSKVFFIGSNREWQRRSIEAARKILAKCDGENVGEEYLPLGALAIDDLLGRVANSGADILVPYFKGEDQLTFLNRFTALGLKSRLTVLMANYDELIAQQLTPDVRSRFYSTSTYFMGVDTNCNRNLLQELLKLDGIDALYPQGTGIITNFGDGAYACVRAFAQAVRDVGSLERETLIDCLETIEIQAPQGLVSMDPFSHHAKVNSYLARCAPDGSFELLQEFGTSAPEIPMRYRAKSPIQPLEKPILPVITEKHSYTVTTPREVGVAVFDAAGTILHANPHMRKLWGYEDADALLNQPITNLWHDPEAWQQAFHDAVHGGQELFRLDAKLADSTVATLEVLLDTNVEGKYTITCGTVDTGDIMTPESVVARILNMADIAIVACDETGTIIKGNRQATNMFGYSSSELAGLSVNNLIPPNLRPNHNKHIKGFIDAPHFNLQMHARKPIAGCRKDGSIFPAEASLSKFRDEENQWVLIASIRDITDLKQQEEQADWQATHDYLTGLPNRTLILEYLAKALHRSTVTNSHLALFLIDLDGLSAINDGYGNEVGDRILIAASERLLHVISHGDTVGRLDGKTFVIIREPCSNPNSASNLATYINDIVRQPLEIQGNRLFVTASIGLVIGQGKDYDTNTILRDADIAMRQVKNMGKDNWWLFSSDLHAKALRRTTISNGLRNALEKNEFSIKLQPIVDALNGKIQGAELLLRWNTEAGPISPDEFIPLAEQSTVIFQIGSWVFEQACRIAARLQDMYAKDAPYITVNVSARQLNDDQLAEKFAACLQRYKISSSKIVLELTETGLMTDAHSSIVILNQLAKLGLRLAVDDFGTGYSSLLQLVRLPLSILKIDKEFTNSIEQRGEHYTIVNAVLRLSQSLRLTTVAEGVEKLEQIEILRELGCDLLQGYYFSQALVEEEFIQMAAKQQATAIPAENIYFYMYISTASEKLNKSQIQTILVQSRQRNTANNITGCLCYMGGKFMQYLEGKAHDVENIVDLIRADTRHHDFKQIMAGTKQNRLFHNWKMNLIDLEGSDIPSALSAHQATSNGLSGVAADPWLAYSVFKAISLGLSE